LSVVLVVIGMIIGAVAVGSDIQRNASCQRIQIAFVQGWQRSYQNYFDQNGIVIGDNAASPSLRVNNSTTALCDLSLVRIMQAAGITIPQGRGIDLENRCVYLDSNGNPQEVQVCFQNISWSIPDGVGGYTVRDRNAMVLNAITPDLARFLDTQVDDRADARFGSLRENSQAASTAGASQEWSIDSRMAFG
jgi:hypothetical protein